MTELLLSLGSPTSKEKMSSAFGATVSMNQSCGLCATKWARRAGGVGWDGMGWDSVQHQY